MNVKNGMFDADGNMVLDRYSIHSESNGRFHTDWLNMMFTRLKISRDLLREDGVIFILIDDNEVDRNFYNQSGACVLDERLAAYMVIEGSQLSRSLLV